MTASDRIKEMYSGKEFYLRTQGNFIFIIMIIKRRYKLDYAHSWDLKEIGDKQ